MKDIQFVQKDETVFKGEIMQNAKIGWSHIKVFSRTNRPEKIKFTWNFPGVVRIYELVC
jgi:hypothetical protein